MKTNIDVLDRPNPDAAIQAQLVNSAIAMHQTRIREWKQSPKKATRSVQKLTREYEARLQTLLAHR